MTTNFNTPKNHLQDSVVFHATQPGGVVRLLVHPVTGEIQDQDQPGEDCPRAREEHGQPAAGLKRGPLVLNTGIASKPHETAKTSHFEQLNRRFVLQEVSRGLLPEEKVSKCLRWRFNSDLGVGVQYAQQLKRAHYSNLITCGRAWICPVCAAKISERRRVELAGAVDAWRARGGSVLLVTFTVRHSLADALGGLLLDMGEAYRALKSGRIWQDFTKQYKITGNVSALEITYSGASGFHPHRHVLFFCEGEITDIEQCVIDWELSDRWQKVLAKFGRFASWGAGVNVQVGYGAVSDYVTKWGVVEEVTKSNSKMGRAAGEVEHYSPFQLLDLVKQGSSWAGPVFVDYAHAVKGKNQLVWSPGLRDLFDLGADLSDQEIAERQDEKAVLLLTLLWPDWRKVLKSGSRAMLLEVAGTGRLDLVAVYLKTLGVEVDL